MSENIYNVGDCYAQKQAKGYLYNRKLFSYGSERAMMNVSVVASSQLYEQGNLFSIANGIKFSFSKKIIAIGNAKAVIQSNGSILKFFGEGNTFVCEDKSGSIMTVGQNGTEVFDVANNREVYDVNGNLTQVYEGDWLLYSYTYQNGKLYSIVDQDNNSITVEYNSAGNVSKLVFAGNSQQKEITVQYNQDSVCIGSFDGAKLLLQLDDTCGTIYTEQNDQYTSCCSKIQITSNVNSITITKYVGVDTIVASDTYVYRDIYNGKAGVVDHTNKNGVVTRYQYELDELWYSYELDGTGDDVFFSANNDFRQPFKTDVVISRPKSHFSKLPAKSTCNATYNPGSQSLVYRIDDVPTSYKYCLHTLTGWFKAPTYQQVPIYVRSAQSGPNIAEVEFSTNYQDESRWQFFSIPFYCAQSNNTFYVYSDRFNSQSTQFQFRDFRITTVGTDMVSNQGVLILKSDVATPYIYRDATADVSLPTDKAIPLEQVSVHFDYLGEQYVEAGTLTFEQLNAHLALARQGKNYLFTDNMTQVYANCENIYLTYTDYNGQSKEVTFDEVYIGQKNVYLDKTTLTYYDYGLADTSKLAQVTTKQLYQDSASVVSVALYDKRFNLCSHQQEGITTTYTYNDFGQLLSQSATDGSTSVTQSATYVNNGTTLRSTVDEFGSTTGYTTEKPFGKLVKVIHPDVVTKSYVYDNWDITQISHSNGVNTSAVQLQYADGNVSGIAQGELSYTYGYTNGKLTSVNKGDQTVAQFSYADNDQTVTQTQGGYSIETHTDKYGRVTQVKSGSTTLQENTFDHYNSFTSMGIPNKSNVSNGSSGLYMTRDHLANEDTYFDQPNGRLSKVVTFTKAGDVSSTPLRAASYEYDQSNRITKTTHTYEDKTYEQTVSYATSSNSALADNRVSQVICRLGGMSKLASSYAYDSYKRLTQANKSHNNVYLSKNIGYANSNGKTSSRVTTVADTHRIAPSNATTLHSMSYSYTDMGQIATIRDTAIQKTVSYQYDCFGRLVRENNANLNKTIVYSYDQYGNITDVKKYTYTTGEPTGTYTQNTYTYSTTYPDRLTAFNGTTIPYNTYGYPTKYNGMNITWTRGRISHASSGTLATGIANYTYTYNAKGQLIRKNYTYLPGQQAMTRYIQTKTIDYTYDTSNQLIQEYRYTTYNDGSTYTQRLTYFYDATGISSCEYTSDSTTNLYHFNKNIQGDVTEIFHQNGTLVGKYLYDAYGNVNIVDDTSGGFVTTNPFRYRGYYYDTDLQLYYLQTRHYDPKTGRFISPDTVDYLDPESASGLNLYAYCNNDPVNHYDPSGHMPEWAQWTLGALAIAGLVVATVLTCGAAGAGAVAIGAAMLTGGVVSAGINVVDQLSDGGKFNWTELAIATLSGTAYGLVTGLTGGTGAWAIAGKFAVAGGTSLLNSWNENATFGETMKSFGGSLLASGILQGTGHLIGKIGPKVLSKILPRNLNHLLTLGDIGSALWSIPAVQTGVIRFAGGIFDAIFNNF